jgi:hypothetical protein
MRPWMYNRQDKSSKAFPAFTGRASFKPIGVHQMTVMAAMGRDDDGACKFRAAKNFGISSPTISATAIFTSALYLTHFAQHYHFRFCYNKSPWAGFGQTLRLRRLSLLLRRIQCHEATQSLQYVPASTHIERMSNRVEAIMPYAQESIASSQSRCTRRRVSLCASYDRIRCLAIASYRSTKARSPLSPQPSQQHVR